MTAQAEDFEVGLSEASFLWLASAGYADRSTVYEALRSMFERLSGKPNKRGWSRSLTWAIKNEQQHGYDLAVFPTGSKSVILIAIKSDGAKGRGDFEAQLKRISDARAEPPKLTSFHLNSVRSPTDFSELLDALTHLTDSQADPVVRSIRNWTVHAPVHHGPLPDGDAMRAYEALFQRRLKLAWRTSDFPTRLQAAFLPTLPTTQGDPLNLQALAQTAEWESAEQAPSAAEDADYFFSRRSPVAVPCLSSGRPPARPLVK